MEASKSKGTWAQYESVLKKWENFCRLKNYSMWNGNVNDVLCFLTYLYNQNLSYSVINTARSTLSTMLGNFDRAPLGVHRLVVNFMKGVGRLRPPAPRYHITWDPDKVLKLMSSWSTDECNLKQLSLKLVSLLALATGQRVQTLSSIEITNIVWDDSIQIKISDRLKTTNVTNSNPILILPPFHDTNLCPVYTLRKYVKLTEMLRSNESKLFVSYAKPHKRVCSQTISRWLVNVLEIAGIDTKIFHAHSYRHASTSKAAVAGVNIDTIFSRAGWKPGSKTFAKFYNRPIISVNDFSEKVLEMRK